MNRAIAAVAIEGSPDFEFREVRLDELRPDEICVRITATGVCRTDAEARHLTPLPAVFGHEGVGIVERTGKAVTRVKPGDRVALTYPYCGACPNCGAAREYHCDSNLPLSFSGRRGDGSATLFLDDNPVSGAFFQQSSFATRAIATERNATRITDKDVPDWVLAGMTCGIMTGAGAVANVFDLQPGQSLAVFGAGAVGLSALLAARVLHCETVVVIDPHQNRRELAAAWGAHALNAGASGTDIRSLAAAGFDAVLDTTGQESVWRMVPGILRTGGQFGAVTTPEPADSWALPIAPFFERFATLRMIIQGASRAAEMLPRMIAWRAEGRFPVDQLISRFPFAEINSAFAESAAGRAIKPVLEMPRQDQGTGE